MCTDPEIKQKLPPGADPEFKLEALMCTNPAIKEDLVNMEPEVKQVTLVSDPDILKVCRCAHPNLGIMIENLPIMDLPVNIY